jgi:hypothetical protein
MIKTIYPSEHYTMKCTIQLIKRDIKIYGVSRTEYVEDLLKVLKIVMDRFEQ